MRVNFFYFLVLHEKCLVCRFVDFRDMIRESVLGAER